MGCHSGPPGPFHQASRRDGVYGKSCGTAVDVWMHMSLAWVGQGFRAYFLRVLGTRAALGEAGQLCHHCTREGLSPSQSHPPPAK
jgi:hypothetical protein